jgi:hypothetical protein
MLIIRIWSAGLNQLSVMDGGQVTKGARAQGWFYHRHHVRKPNRGAPMATHGLHPLSLIQDSYLSPSPPISFGYNMQEHIGLNSTHSSCPQSTSAGIDRLRYPSINVPPSTRHSSDLNDLRTRTPKRTDTTHQDIELGIYLRSGSSLLSNPPSPRRSIGSGMFWHLCTFVLCDQMFN